MLGGRDGKHRGHLEPLDPAALRAAVETIGKELLLPGAMVLLRTPAGDFAYGYGATELGGATAPAGDTHFRIASNTKTMTAAVTVLLAQEGKLRLDDPVSKYVEGVPDGDDVTVGDLLKMRSGLPEITDAPELPGDPRPGFRAGSGRRKSCSPSHSSARRCSRPTRSSSTATRTTSCSA